MDNRRRGRALEEASRDDRESEEEEEEKGWAEKSVVLVTPLLSA
jgi:hypothetical protein